MELQRLTRSLAVLCLLVVPVVVAAAGDGTSQNNLPLPITPNDLIQPGTQPETLTDELLRPSNCRDCHGDYDKTVEPFARWAGSMMAQASRDPIFYACLAIANQDLNGGGELCLRCHTPVGWLQGRSEPTDGSALDPELGDLDGISCHVCHRMVDPVYDPENPMVDQTILADLDQVPGEPHTGQYVVDPEGHRRGPYFMGIGFPWHPWHQSPFHQEALLCANCHDVSNPALSRQPDGTYRLNDLDAQHPTHDKRHEFPVERTFTEWKLSVYERAPIETGGRFGGNKTAVSTCQDCHLPDTTGIGCKPGLGGELRDDLALHNFNGANSWVLRAVRELYPDEETGLSDEIVEDAIARNHEMLGLSADLEAFVRSDGGVDELVVRVINRTGHKLPTGYGEGRRFWINARFYDLNEQLLVEHGHYDATTAELTTADTRVYESVQGLDSYMAGETGLPEGESFHFVLNNTVLKDNRIPPRGYNRQQFELNQAGPRAHEYAEEQYWDDTVFSIPEGAARVAVELFHQTTSREYIEFLRDENHTNTKGQEAYDLWEQFGKSAPVTMATTEVLMDDEVCPTPIVYGLGSIDATGEQARLAWAGTPSVSIDDFQVILSGGEPGAMARLLGGAASASITLDDGQLLVDRPRVLAAAVVGSDGTATFDLPLGDKPQLADREVYLQVAFRVGPIGEPSTSEGLHIDVCP